MPRKYTPTERLKFAGLTPSIPTVRHYVLPEAEREQAIRLDGTMQGLSSFADEFGRAVQLLDFCERQIAAAQQTHHEKRAEGFDADERRRYRETTAMFAGWAKIATRDAVMQIYHFVTAFRACNALLSSCPVLDSYVDPDEVRAAGDVVNLFFRKNEEARNAVGHAADLKHERHAVDGLMTINDLEGRSVVATMKHQKIRTEVSAATLERLHEVLQHFYGAFALAEETTFRMNPGDILKPRT